MFAQKTNQCAENDPVYQIGIKSTQYYTPQRQKLYPKIRHCPYAPIKAAKVKADLTKLHSIKSIKKNLFCYKPRRNTHKKRRFSPFKHT